MDINEYSRLAIRTSATNDMVGNACFGTFDPDRANNRDTEAEARAMADASK